MKHPDWLKLDNAAKIYPAVSSRKSPAQFRLAVTFDSPVNYRKMQTAWKLMIKRCPYFQVYLQRGFFWYYLQRHQDIPALELLESTPVFTFQPRQSQSHLIRISVCANTIALDFSHILTDGSGGLRFLLALICEYLRLQGIPIGKIKDVPHPDDEPGQDEFADAFRQYFAGDLPHPQPLSEAYHLSGKADSENRFRMISGSVPMSEFLELTRKYQVTVTEFLTANYLFCLKELYFSDTTKRKKTMIRLQVPVNMRKFHPSQTMRNFSLYVSPEIDIKLGKYSFEDILKKVHHTLRLQIDQKELGRQVARNVGGELNPFVRGVPLFLKDIYLNRIYSKLGEKCYSGVLSNLGAISLPPTAAEKIKSFSIRIMPNNVMKKSCAVLSYGNDLVINFCSVIDSVELERLFFTKLVDSGFSVRVWEE